MTDEPTNGSRDHFEDARQLLQSSGTFHVLLVGFHGSRRVYRSIDNEIKSLDAIEWLRAEMNTFLDQKAAEIRAAEKGYGHG